MEEKHSTLWRNGQVQLGPVYCLLFTDASLALTLPIGGSRLDKTSASHDLMKVKQASCKTLECHKETKGYFLINRVPSNLQWPKAHGCLSHSSTFNKYPLICLNSSFRNFKFSDTHKNNQQQKHISKIWSIHKWHHPRIFFSAHLWALFRPVTLPQKKGIISSASLMSPYWCHKRPCHLRVRQKPTLPMVLFVFFPPG